MDDKEKGLPMGEELRRIARGEITRYFQHNGLFGGLWQIALTLILAGFVITVGLFLVFIGWAFLVAVYNGLPH